MASGVVGDWPAALAPVTDRPKAQGRILLVKNPLHQIVRDNAMLIRLFGRELGFLPSAREGLRVRDDEARDPLDEWIAGRT
jgi:phage terminase small subunit